jgi:anti-sigma factor RsiW
LITLALQVPASRGIGETPQTGINALAHEASYAYAVFGPDRGRPVEIKAADTADLVRWVSNRLERQVSVPDLSAGGYRFMGGRLISIPDGPAAFFMYDDDKGMRIAILVRPMSQERAARMTEHREGHVAGYAWADNGIGYSVVGGAEPDLLHPLANEVRRQFDAKI